MLFLFNQKTDTTKSKWQMKELNPATEMILNLQIMHIHERGNSCFIAETVSILCPYAFMIQPHMSFPLCSPFSVSAHSTVWEQGKESHDLAWKPKVHYPAPQPFGLNTFLIDHPTINLSNPTGNSLSCSLHLKFYIVAKSGFFLWFDS